MRVQCASAAPVMQRRQQYSIDIGEPSYARGIQCSYTRLVSECIINYLTCRLVVLYSCVFGLSRAFLEKPENLFFVMPTGRARILNEALPLCHDIQQTRLYREL